MGTLQFDTHERAAPSTLVWGFVRIEAIRGTIAQVQCDSEGHSVCSISIFDAGPTSAVDPAMVYMKMYRLPEATGVFNDDLKLIATAEGNWPLAGGRAFDENVLRPREVPQTWRHKAVQLGGDNRGIAHAWRGPRFALLLRYALQRGDMLDLQLFQWATKNLSVIDGAWLIDAPGGGTGEAQPMEVLEEVEAEDDEAEVQLLEDDDAPAASGQSGVKNPRPLDPKESRQLQGSAANARKYLELSDQASIAQVLDAIHAAVDRERSMFRSLDEKVAYNFAASMGVLWGMAVCRVAGWQWRAFTHEGLEILGIVSPNASHAVATTNYMYLQLAQQGDNVDNTVKLLFNMIRENKLPASQPGACMMLG